MIPDFNQLAEQVRDVISYSQGIDKCHLDYYPTILKWWDAKEHLFLWLGGKMIYEHPTPVSIEYDLEVKHTMFEKFMEEMVEYLEDRDENGDEIDYFCEWLNDNEAGFFPNQVIRPLADESEMKQGMKLLRAFKFFDFGDEAVRHIQDMASRVIQKQKIEGTLCISIHPLDYLSISDNKSNWRSCHALDGEYRAGNFSYMIDQSTVVCYIKSKNDVQLDRFPFGMLWNNKKWRVLLHIHPHFHIAYVNRQYPFSCDDIIHMIQKTQPMFNSNLCATRLYCKDSGFRVMKEEDGQEQHLEQNYFRMYGYILDPDEMCGGDPNSLQYNDFVFSPHYTPQYIMSNRIFFSPNKRNIKREFAVEIGKRVPCPCGCGNDLTDSCTMICESCMSSLQGVIGECVECGCRVFQDERFGVNQDDELLCEDCYAALEGRQSQSQLRRWRMWVTNEME